ncbi:MAG: transcription antitermination factor NusB [Clostridia bacterium]|nr:transcription antitermination factor NusB [Clostridia bacterium]MBR2325358.1 transcription antitermination factor NusB [Clostridia bacterium]
MNRKEARENAFLLLYEGVCKNDESAEEIFEKATAERELQTDAYVKDVFFGVYAKAEALEEVISKNLVGWKKERVSLVSMALLRLGAYEILFREDIPVKVSINECIELSKKYDDDKAYIFVNGVLNAISKDQSLS